LLWRIFRARLHLEGGARYPKDAIELSKGWAGLKGPLSFGAASRRNENGGKPGDVGQGIGKDSWDRGGSGNSGARSKIS
jgi:hypothetical protein